MSQFDSVVVFVDALPYEERLRMSSVERVLRWVRPIQPGFGYSINVKSELFAGLTPDEVGFLNEWGFSPGKGYSWGRHLARFQRVLSANRILKRVVSKLLSRLVGENLRNIPFSLLDSVFRTGVTAYERHYERPTVFSEHGVERYLYSEYSGDGPAYDALCARLQRDGEPVSAFLAMAELDHIMHRDGKGTSAYEQEIEHTDRRLNLLWDVLQTRGNDPRLLVLSDHGMAQVTQFVPFDIEKHIEGAGVRYGYFVDATMVRIWALDDQVRGAILKWLERTELHGRVLDESERATWGITSRNFGDIIVLLEEGAVYVPNFFSDFGCNAMHGYLPSLASQQGLIASSTQLDSSVDGCPLPAPDVCDLLHSFYRGAAIDEVTTRPAIGTEPAQGGVSPG